MMVAAAVTVPDLLLSFGCYFYTYDTVKRALSSADQHHRPTVAVSLVAGGLAGLGAWLPCFPLDVIKSRVQRSHDPRLTTRMVIQQIWSEGRLRAFWKGSFGGGGLPVGFIRPFFSLSVCPSLSWLVSPSPPPPLSLLVRLWTDTASCRACQLGDILVLRVDHAVSARRPRKKIDCLFCCANEFIGSCSRSPVNVNDRRLPAPPHHHPRAPTPTSHDLTTQI